MQLKERIISLCSLMSVSGHEAYDAERLAKEVGKDFDECHHDAVGNTVLVCRCGRKDAKKILIDTHFDEIGMLVTDICDGGFLRIINVGGIDPAILSAADVLIYGKRTLHGVICATPPHLQKEADKDKLQPVDELLIDTGYQKDELEKLVSIGTPVGFLPRYTELTGDRLCGKSLDNKACAAIAVQALLATPREALAADVYLLLSAQEETAGTGGAAVGSFAIDPDYAMVIDVNLAKVPDTSEADTVPLGKGPSVSISPVADRRLTRLVRDLAERRGIPYSPVAAPSSTGTNTPAVNLAGRGIPTVDIGLPLKNMHTYNELLCLSDAEALCALITAFITDRQIGEVIS